MKEFRQQREKDEEIRIVGEKIVSVKRNNGAYTHYESSQVQSLSQPLKVALPSITSSVTKSNLSAEANVFCSSRHSSVQQNNGYKLDQMSTSISDNLNMYSSSKTSSNSEPGHVNKSSYTEALQLVNMPTLASTVSS